MYEQYTVLLAVLIGFHYSAFYIFLLKLYADKMLLGCAQQITVINPAWSYKVHNIVQNIKVCFFCVCKNFFINVNLLNTVESRQEDGKKMTNL